MDSVQDLEPGGEHPEGRVDGKSHGRFLLKRAGRREAGKCDQQKGAGGCGVLAAGAG